MIKRKFSELKVGEKCVFEKTITDADIFAFAGICGDFNPLHMSDTYANASRFKGRIVHGLLVASLVDYTMTGIVGLGGVHISQKFHFKAPVYLRDTITVETEIVSLDPQRKRLRLSSVLTNQNQKVVLTGEAEGMLLE